MRTDPLTDHAAQVLARMKFRQEEDRAEARVMRAAAASARRDDRALFLPPFSTVRVYQET
jgi:hypothetical protein